MSRRAKERYLDGTALMSRVSAHGYRGFIKSVQRATIAITGATSNTATVTSISLANSVLNLVGQSSSSVLGTLNSNQNFMRIELTSATVVTAFVDTSPGADTITVSFELIEYYPGVIKSVQRGNATGANPETVTITAVNMAKARVDHLGYTLGSAAKFTETTSRISLTAATTLVVTSSAATGNTSYQVVEYY